MSLRRVRVPFIPLEYEKRIISKPRELMVDYNNYKVYVMGEDGINDIEVPNRDLIKEFVHDKIYKLIGSATENITLEELVNLVSQIEEYMKLMTEENGSGVVDTITKVINSMREFKISDDDILTLLSNLVDVEEGKELVSNNFTDELLSKLNSIEDEANYYRHPKEKQCTGFDPVISVNGKKGFVNLSKIDIEGLEGVDKEANFYEHPDKQQCNHIFRVNTVNSRTGAVTIDKNELGLSNLVNSNMASVKEMNDRVPNKYVEMNALMEVINTLLYL